MNLNPFKSLNAGIDRHDAKCARRHESVIARMDAAILKFEEMGKDLKAILAKLESKPRK